MQDAVNILRDSAHQDKAGEPQSQLLKKALLGLACKEQGEAAKGKDDGDEQSIRETEKKEGEHSGLWVIQKITLP